MLLFSAFSRPPGVGVGFVGASWDGIDAAAAAAFERIKLLVLSQGLQAAGLASRTSCQG